MSISFSTYYSTMGFELNTNHDMISICIYCAILIRTTIDKPLIRTGGQFTVKKSTLKIVNPVHSQNLDMNGVHSQATSSVFCEPRFIPMLWNELQIWRKNEPRFILWCALCLSTDASRKNVRRRLKPAWNLPNFFCSEQPLYVACIRMY